MTEPHPIQWTKTAETDLLAVITHIKNTRPQTTRKLFTEIKAQATKVELFPEPGRVVPELLSQGLVQYRELIIPPWRLVYRITGTTLYVLAFIDARRNVEDLLLDRFVRPCP